MRANKQVVDGLLAQLKLAQDRAHENKRQAKERDLLAAGDRREAAGFDEQAAQLRQLLRFADPDHADAYADPPRQSVEAYAERTAILDGIREMLDFLEGHPDIPVASLADFRIYPRGGGLTEEMEVDRIAREMGVPSGRPAPNDHYRAVRTFGPVYRHNRTVTLEAMSCDRTDLNWKPGNPFPDWWPSEPQDGAVGQADAEPVTIDVDQADAAVPAPAVDTCGAQAPHTGFLCTREPGHEGDHRGNNIVWPLTPRPVQRCEAIIAAAEGVLRCVRDAGHDHVYADAADLTMLRHYHRAYGEWDVVDGPAAEVKA